MSDEQDKKNMLEKANVVAVGHAKEEKDGERTGRETLTAFVHKKKPKSEIKDQDLIPSKTESGNPTDVVEIGRVNIEVEHDNSDYPVKPSKQVETQTRDIETNQRHRPFPQGSSIGHPKVTAGTAGLVLWKRSEKEVGNQTFVYPEPVVFTNNHVAAAENKAEVGEPILQPGKYDGAKNSDKYVVGVLEDYIEIKDKGNKVDGAWFSLRDESTANSFVLGMGVPTEVGKVEKGDLAKKGNTRTTAYREGEVLTTDATVRINFSSGVKEFEDQIISRSISKGGDSGSAVFDDKGRWIGNLNAGSSSVTIINKAENILEQTPLNLNMNDIYDYNQGDKI